jgi:hypothetical protein
MGIFSPFNDLQVANSRRRCERFDRRPAIFPFV